MNEPFPQKAPVLGTPISLTSYQEVLERLDGRPADRATVVAVCNVHSVMSARRDPQLASALESAEIATPDGMPLVWCLRATARQEQTRVYGPELMERGLRFGVQRAWRHYFYGATTETLGKLKTAAAKLAPGVQIVGAHAPPFRAQTEAERSDAIEDIKSVEPDIVWVGIGMPKQELWMHQVRDRLPGMALLGVGASFDFIAGNVPQAPPWMQERGLEWAFRFSKEPRRLWRRYIWNNPAYLLLCAGQIIKHKVGPRDREL